MIISKYICVRAYVHSYMDMDVIIYDNIYTYTLRDRQTDRQIDRYRETQNTPRDRWIDRYNALFFATYKRVCLVYVSSWT